MGACFEFGQQRSVTSGLDCFAHAGLVIAKQITAINLVDHIANVPFANEKGLVFFRSGFIQTFGDASVRACRVKTRPTILMVRAVLSAAPVVGFAGLLRRARNDGVWWIVVLVHLLATTAGMICLVSMPWVGVSIESKVCLHYTVAHQEITRISS